MTDDPFDEGEAPVRTDADRERLSVVEEYADRVLEVGRDRWSGEGTPLLADGVRVADHEPARWRYDGETFVLSNAASQQNLFRTLSGLTALTGDPTYEERAKAVVDYHFEHFAGGNGLLEWGGHRFIDLENLEPIGHIDNGAHEFKTHFPFYELMWETDSEATRQFLRAVWNAHVLDWETLDMNRHGEYGLETGDLWDNSFSDPEPFYEGTGLSFINIGADLVHAAGALYRLGGEEGALTWGKRLAGMYVKARHPETGLGAYQYTKPERREEPPETGPLTGNLTNSKYGDRAENQFGDRFGDVAREGWVHWGSRLKTIYVTNAVMQLGLAERLGGEGRQLRDWIVDGLDALAEHGYVPERNAFRPMWADGTDLTGKRFGRTGYYGEEGTEWKPYGADMGFLLSYVRGYRLSGRNRLWETARDIADGLGIGDVGAEPSGDVSLETAVDDPTPEEVFALLELYRTSRDPAYLERARRVADGLIEERYHHDFFLPSEDHIHARFDTVEPLAILRLDAVLRGEPERVPAYVGGSGYVHGTFDGHGRTRDTKVIWPATRE